MEVAEVLRKSRFARKESETQVRPPETFDEYIARILSYPRGVEPRAILRRTPARLARRIAGASRARLTKRPAPGKWSARDILAHLSETELLWGTRLRLILGHSGVPLVGMDQDVWAKRYGSVDPRRALATFTALRASNLELLSSLRRADRMRWGRHSQFGRLTVDRIFRLLAGHDINHSRQIEAILKRKGPRRGKR